MIDLTNMSAHAIIDRKARFNFIENTIGFGERVCSAKKDRDEKGDAVATLTSTGVVIIEVEETKEIITAYIGTLQQVKTIWCKANKTKRMEEKLWQMVNYNNNTENYKRACGIA